jgi:hypothetical protein
MNAMQTRKKKNFEYVVEWEEDPSVRVYPGPCLMTFLTELETMGISER